MFSLVSLWIWIILNKSELHLQGIQTLEKNSSTLPWTSKNSSVEVLDLDLAEQFLFSLNKIDQIKKKQYLVFSVKLQFGKALGLVQNKLFNC